MFEKTKEFWEEHKGAIIGAGIGTAVGVGMLVLHKKLNTTITIPITVDDTVDHGPKFELMKKFGAFYKEGYEIPFIEKDMAIKFLEEGDHNIYQFDVFDGNVSIHTYKN